MTGFSISYIFNNQSPDLVIRRRDLIGGFRLTCNDAVLTQSTLKGDKGYFGHWLWPDMMEVIRSIDDLINHGRTLYDDESGAYSILFKLVNDQVYIAIVTPDAEEEEDEKEIELLKQDYPVGSAGCYIPVKTYFSEVLRVGKEFIDDLNATFKNYDRREIDLLEYNLGLMEKLVDEYNKTY